MWTHLCSLSLCLITKICYVQQTKISLILSIQNCHADSTLGLCRSQMLSSYPIKMKCNFFAIGRKQGRNKFLSRCTFVVSFFCCIITWVWLVVSPVLLLSAFSFAHMHLVFKNALFFPVSTVDFMYEMIFMLKLSFCRS